MGGEESLTTTISAAELMWAIWPCTPDASNAPSALCRIHHWLLAFVLARCEAGDEALQLVITADAHTPSIRANFISTLLPSGQQDQAMRRAWYSVHEGCSPLPTLLCAPENRALRQHADFGHLVRMIPGWAGGHRDTPHSAPILL